MHHSVHGRDGFCPCETGSEMDSTKESAPQLRPRQREQEQYFAPLMASIRRCIHIDFANSRAAEPPVLRLENLGQTVAVPTYCGCSPQLFNKAAAGQKTPTQLPSTATTSEKQHPGRIGVVFTGKWRNPLVPSAQKAGDPAYRATARTSTDRAWCPTS